MKLFTKSVVFAAAFAGTLLCAAEVHNLIDPKVISAVHGCKLTFAKNQLTHTGRAFMFGKTKYTIDPAKKYTFKYTISNKSDKIAVVYAGVNVYDAQGRSFPIWAWQGNKKAFTEVAADAKKGDTQVRVKNAQGWATHAAACVVADAKEDFSDIPNTKRVFDQIKKCEKDGDLWVLTLAAPLKADLAAGTKIRQHYHGGYFYLPNSSPCRIAPGKTVNISTVIQGAAAELERFSGKKWPLNSKKFSFLMLSDYTDTKAEITVKDATLTVE